MCSNGKSWGYKPRCDDCILNDNKEKILGDVCCNEWLGWNDATNENNLRKARYNATLLIKRLKKEIERLNK